MHSRNLVHIVHCHAEGEVGDVIVGGVAPPPGDTLWEQSRFIARDASLRNFVLNEPRGGVFRHVNLLVPARHPEAVMGFIIMEPEDTPPMSGSNSICVATVLLETGIVPITEPVTRFKLEAPGGLVSIKAQCSDGKVDSITVHNVASFASRLGAVLSVEGLGELVVDTAFGGDSFVFVNAADAGCDLIPANARQISETGIKITTAANRQLGFHHPANPDWAHISFCCFYTSLENIDGVLQSRQAVVIQPGKVDRSPTGTACSARLALLHARGELETGRGYTALSLIDSKFQARIVSETAIGDTPAIIPAVTGRAWLTGASQQMLDPRDPWPQGYRITDTWPQKIELE